MSQSIVTPREMWKGLLWKEARQLLPLSLVLIVVCILLLICWSEFYPSRYATTQLQSVPLILPALFAVGAAAVLVCQEREQRTLSWLTSLPIPGSRVIMAKFTAATAGLIAMWIACWCLCLLINLGESNPRANGFMLRGVSSDFIAFMHVHSFFVLICGFYTAWRIKNTFASLIAILVLAAIPLVLLESWYALRTLTTGLRFVEPAYSAAATMLVTLPVMAIIGWLAYRAAIRSLSPSEPPSLPARGAGDWSNPWSVRLTGPRPEAPFRFSISSLVWQSIHHNRLALTGIISMVLAGFIGLLALARSGLGETGGFVFGCLLISALGVCWLGVFAFTGDGSSKKLRFFAERGISPTKILIGRQLFGLSVLASLVLLYALCSYQLPNDTSEESLYLPSAASVAIVVWVIYVTSLWICQLIPTLAASAILAPVVSLAAVYWLGFSAIELETPLWLIIAVGSGPLVVAWLMMQRFMDGGRRWSLWLVGGIAVLLFIFVPMIPLARQVTLIPTIPADVKAQLETEADPLWRQTRMQPAKRITLTESSIVNQAEFREMSVAQAAEVLDQRRWGPSDQLQIPPADAATPLTINYQALIQALSGATYQKLKFQMNPDDDSEAEALGEWISTLTLIGRGLRNSTNFYDQEHADTIEIWLTQALASDPVTQLRDQPYYREAIALISDSETRNQARHRAVLVSWYAWQLWKRGELPGQDLLAMPQSRSISNLAILSLQRQTDSSTKQRWMHDRLTEAITDTLLKYNEAGSAGSPTEPLRRQLHQRTIGQQIEFEDGPYARRLRVGADSIPPLSSIISGKFGSYPGSQWYAPWETDAKQLADDQADEASAEGEAS